MCNKTGYYGQETSVMGFPGDCEESGGQTGAYNVGERLLRMDFRYLTHYHYG